MNGATVGLQKSTNTTQSCMPISNERLLSCNMYGSPMHAISKKLCARKAREISYERTRIIFWSRFGDYFVRCYSTVQSLWRRHLHLST